LFLKRFDWPRPALVVGFVLSHNLEPSIYQTAQVYGFSFLQRPQAIAIALMILASLFAGARTLIKNNSLAKGEEKKAVSNRRPQIVFTLILIGLVAYTLVSDVEVSYLTRLFPMWVGIVAVIGLGLVLLQQMFSPLTNVTLADFDQLNREEHEGRPSEYVYIGWFIAFLGLVWVLGLSLAAAIFVFAFITVECGRPLLRNATFALGCLFVLVSLTSLLDLEYPRGIVPTYFSLPWWIQ
jgi:putative tricarboxylic transport membrane protein